MATQQQQQQQRRDYAPIMVVALMESNLGLVVVVTPCSPPASTFSCSPQISGTSCLNAQMLSNK